MRCRNQMLLAVGLYCAICVACTGCGESVVEDNTVATPVPEVASVPATPQEESNSSEEEAKPDVGAQQQVVEKPVEFTFEPPFPERIDLFQVPRRQGNGLVKSKGQQEASVELLGFGKVDEQIALIAVNGLVASVAEGGEHFGIEVISIQPPKVVLQRGRQRWQAALTLQ